MSETVSTPEPSAEPAKTTLDILEIMAILPHRYPFLLIDRVIEMERRERIVAIFKSVSRHPQHSGRDLLGVSPRFLKLSEPTAEL